MVDAKRNIRVKEDKLCSSSSLIPPSPDFSLVIPLFNEEDNLRPLAAGIVDAMNSLSESYEVILVNDGSTDDSGRVAKELCLQNPHFRSLVFQQNCGQTAALDAGFKAAKGKVIITMDADLQQDPRDIPLLLAKLDKYDAVCGYRIKRADSWIRLISSQIANFVRNKLSDENIRDVGCSLKVFKKECLDGLKLYDGMHRFLPTLIKMDGYTVMEVQVNHFPRKYGASKYNIHNRLFKSFRDLLAVRWMKSRKLNYKIVKQYDGKDKQQKEAKQAVLK